LVEERRREALCFEQLAVFRLLGRDVERRQDGVRLVLVESAKPRSRMTRAKPRPS